MLKAWNVGALFHHPLFQTITIKQSQGWGIGLQLFPICEFWSSHDVIWASEEGVMNLSALAYLPTLLNHHICPDATFWGSEERLCSGERHHSPLSLGMWKIQVYVETQDCSHNSNHHHVSYFLLLPHILLSISWYWEFCKSPFLQTWNSLLPWVFLDSPRWQCAMSSLIFNTLKLN